MSRSSICFWPAVELARRIRAKEITVREVVAAHLDQIEQVNPDVNAIVTLVPERAMKQAGAADEALARGETCGPLHGLPIAHKDLVLTKDIRTTFGSPIYRNFIPEEDALIVQRLRDAGAITIGKTNTPEFGAGSQTYNEVFGETLNPYDLRKTSGGSSGGAAAALACGMLPLADGSDLGGSLRNPASFCNVVGFRPSPGRVPQYPRESGWFTFPVQGPMARTVEDVALMLGAMAGPDSRDPLSIAEPGSRFLQSLDRDFKGTRVAWSQDLGGLPVDARVSAVIDQQESCFETLGCEISKGEPDFSRADESFKVWRAWWLHLTLGELVKEHRSQIKETVLWNVDQGAQLKGQDLERAEKLRTGLFHRVRRFMADFEFLILPVSQVPPFDVAQRYVEEINGHKMETYIDWMKSCYFITVTGLPAVSVPCGFTEDGLPVGLQIVGRHHDDLGVLQLAHAFEQETQCWKNPPPVAT